MTMFECAWSYGYGGSIRGRDFRATEHNNRNIFTSSSASLLRLFGPNEAPIPVGRGPVFASMDKRVSRPAPGESGLSILVFQSGSARHEST